MKKIAIIGDLVSSKRIKERSRVQKNLQDVLIKLNSRDESILSPYTITLGDEFQAVLKNSTNLFTDFIAIMVELFPVKVRFSIGVGDIITKINKEMAIGMDGQAFHNAREGIEELKRTSYYFNLKGLTSDNSNLVRKNLFLVSNLISKWNFNQLTIFSELQRGTKVKNISQLIGISEQAVYKSINKLQMHLIREITEEFSIIINHSLK